MSDNNGESRKQNSQERNTQERSAGTGSTANTATGGVDSGGPMGEKVTGGSTTEGTGMAKTGASGSHGIGSGIEGGGIERPRGESDGTLERGARDDNQDPAEGSRNQYGSREDQMPHNAPDARIDMSNRRDEDKGHHGS